MPKRSLQDAFAQGIQPAAPQPEARHRLADTAVRCPCGDV